VLNSSIARSLAVNRMTDPDLTPGTAQRIPRVDFINFRINYPFSVDSESIRISYPDRGRPA
jgi:hypothetical protein